MTYFDGHDIAPAPNADDAPFWQRCAARTLCFQSCNACGTVTHPPINVCPHCQSFDRGWVEAPAAARVFSFTWIHTASHDAIKRPLPYNVAVIEFPELPGVRLISNVIDAAQGQLRIGDRVELVWETIGEHLALPRFRLAENRIPLAGHS
jgi:uncharacterized OB-fold protein